MSWSDTGLIFIKLSSLSNLFKPQPPFALALAMPPFRVPFLQPRRSFHRLRSFHLTPAAKNAQVPVGDTTSPTPSYTTFEESVTVFQIEPPPLVNRMIVPLRGTTIVTLAILTSLLFILCISFSFIGADADGPPFVPALNAIAQASPGVSATFD